jgi:O-6-methylguanine DNA methyltransferase
MTVWTSAEFPLGIVLFLASDGQHLVRASFARGVGEVPHDWNAAWEHRPEDPILQQALRELNEYFAKDREDFSVPLKPSGTPFQLSVWKALEEIPYGQTRTYRQIAELVGRPTATRAVGAANGQNPLPVFLPCHRVIGSNGALTGFGGGLETKAELLRLEGVLL